MRKIYKISIVIFIMLSASVVILRYNQLKEYNMCLKYGTSEVCNTNKKWSKLYTLYVDKNPTASSIFSNIISMDLGFIMNFLPFIIVVISLTDFCQHIKSKSFFNEICREKYSKYVIKKWLDTQKYSLIIPIYMILLYVLSIVIAGDYSLAITHINLIHILDILIISSYYINLGFCAIIFFKNVLLAGITVNSTLILIISFGEQALTKFIYNAFNFSLPSEIVNIPFHFDLRVFTRNPLLSTVYGLLLLSTSMLLLFVIFKNKERFIKYAEM